MSSLKKDINKDINKDNKKKNIKKRVGKLDKYVPEKIEPNNIKPKVKRRKRKRRTKQKSENKTKIKKSKKSNQSNQSKKSQQNTFLQSGIKRSKKEAPSSSFDKYWYPRQNQKRSRQKKKKAKNEADNIETIWIIRHLHRMDRDEPDNWKKQPRYNQNFLDSPLTQFGKLAAQKAGKEIIKNTPNINNVKYVYTSPFTRCIETSLEIAKEITKYTGKLVQLRIEYGIAEAVNIQLGFIKVIDRSLFIDRVPLLDFKLTTSQIAKDYFPYIDTKYKSLYKKSDIILETVKESAERTVKTMNYLTNNFKNMIICSHQIPVTIANMFLYNRPYPVVYLNKINPTLKDKKDMNPKRLGSYGILSGFQKDEDRWKYIYPPNNDYFQSIDIP